MQVSQLLGSPTWTGGGPGLMQAASQGAAAAGGAVGGIRLQREAGTTVLSGTYLPEDAQVRWERWVLGTWGCTCKGRAVLVCWWGGGGV
jgi:hypothetical protein